MQDGVKGYRTYDEQVELLVSRGMDVGEPDDAAGVLRRINYYRLSGYWYPFRQQTRAGRSDDFYPGTRLDDVVALYEFDARLRAATFSVLAPLELTFRALLGHELGRIGPCSHLDPTLLGPTARDRAGVASASYSKWRDSYDRELARSREDFVAHHHRKYGGTLPVWAAVELLDWGALSYLYGLAPRTVQDEVAERCGLNGPQLSSWLKSLNVLRNTCAHHGRLFNRVHTLQPRLPRVGRHPDLDTATTQWNRTFGQLTMIQFLLDRFQLGRTNLLPAVVRSYPRSHGSRCHTSVRSGTGRPQAGSGARDERIPRGQPKPMWAAEGSPHGRAITPRRPRAPAVRRRQHAPAAAGRAGQR